MIILVGALKVFVVAFWIVVLIYMSTLIPEEWELRKDDFRKEKEK